MDNEMTQVAVSSNGIARRDGGELVVRDPFSPDVMHRASDVQTLIKSARARLEFRRKQFADLGDIKTADIDKVKELRREIADDDNLLKEYDNSLRDALLDMSGFLSYVVQTKGTGKRIDPLSVRGKLAELSNELKERIESEKVKAPPRTWVITLSADDDAFNKIADYAKRQGAPFEMFAVPQNDGEVKKIQKWFEVNQ